MLRNELGGNGSTFAAANGLSNDFGVGVIGNSADNIVEANSFGGNMNGVFLSGANTLRNAILRNVFTGNPPIQIDAAFGLLGFDIQNLTPAGANMFEENLCRTYFGAGSNPCLTLPNFAGHQNPPIVPVIPPVACTTPAPAAGWVCVNGGWVPPDHPLAGSPPPPTPPATCPGPDPFAPIPGLVGECVNGGWIPRPIGGGGE